MSATETESKSTQQTHHTPQIVTPHYVSEKVSFVMYEKPTQKPTSARKIPFLLSPRSRNRVPLIDYM